MVCYKVIFLFLIFLITGTLAAKRNKDIHLEKKKLSDAKVTTNPTESCHGFKCGPGRVCILDSKTNLPKCVCVPDCATVIDPRRKVCSNYNNTWQSDCHLHRHRCLCEENLSENCLDEHKHMHIDYYGECTNSLNCEETVLLDFPRRLKEWLFNILSSEHFTNPKNLIENDHDQAHKWLDAVIWKFCDLDIEPKDRFVSRHELFPLRAPLLTMEPCIHQFLDQCDSNTDHKITLQEWGKCLGTEDGEITDKCDKFKSIIYKEHGLTNP